VRRAAAAPTRAQRRSRGRTEQVRGRGIAAHIRTRAGERLQSPALIADGNHARADAYVSLVVVAAATAAVAAGAPILDPVIGIRITIAILRITWASCRTVRDDVRGATHHHH
jgi:divalent metal cation (Fe/Co/Zn/Cd) transporter